VDPIAVDVRRGDVVESRHRVHAVAVRHERVVAAHGDPHLVTFMRSAAKPLQALPVARARPDLDDRDLAIASASHLADVAQLAAVRALLAKAPASEDDLECGPEGNPPSRVNHNCSGKHAAMLALARARHWPAEGYRLAAHPVQRAMLEEVASAAGVDPAALPTAVDGCGVVTFALPLARMATAFARLERRQGGDRIARAMRMHPDLVRGPAATDTRLMRALDGWIAKGGAEGLLCAAGPDGVGVAVKAEDGSMRATAPAAAALLAELGHDVGELATVPVLNSRGERVGEVAVAHR
jgi:L-asparaginase II